MGVDVHDAALVARRGLASERRDARHWRRVGQCGRSVVSEEPRAIEMSVRGEVIVLAALMVAASTGRVWRMRQSQTCGREGVKLGLFGVARGRTRDWR